MGSSTFTQTEYRTTQLEKMSGASIIRLVTRIQEQRNVLQEFWSQKNQLVVKIAGERERLSSLQDKEVEGLTNDELLAREEAIEEAVAKIEDEIARVSQLEDVIKENENILECLQLRLDNIFLTTKQKTNEEKLNALNLALEKKKQRLDQLRLEEEEEREILAQFNLQ